MTIDLTDLLGNWREQERPPALTASAPPVPALHDAPAARAERQEIEDSLAEQASAELARFLVVVESEANVSLDLRYLTAASLREPFSLTLVRSLWARTVTLAFLPASLADAVYGKVTQAVRVPRTSKAAALRAVAEALAFEGVNGWQAVAERHARTAATAQFGALQVARFSQAGVTAKRWDADIDNATRDTHRAADGQVRPLAQAFTVGTSLMQYPGDPSAPPEETENCRCVPVAAILR